MFEDRRRGFATHLEGRDAVIEHVNVATVHRKALIDLLPDGRVAVRTAIRSAPSVALLSLWIYGTDEHGSRVEYEHLVIPVVENGLSTRSEVFAVTDLDAAVARFDELSQ